MTTKPNISSDLSHNSSDFKNMTTSWSYRFYLKLWFKQPRYFHSRCSWRDHILRKE